MVTRRDYAVFADDRFVTNALLTEEEAADMESEGFRCLVVRDIVGEPLLPAFRGRRYVGPKRSQSWKWDR